MSDIAANMESVPKAVAAAPMPLRMWPAWMLVLLQTIALVLTVTPSIQNVTRFLIMMAGPLVSGLLYSVWLLFASRLGTAEKLVLAATGVLAPLLSMLISDPDPALRTTQWIYGIPLAMILTTIGLSAGSSARRALTAVVLLSLGWCSFALVRNEGFDGDYYAELVWRWNPVHEQSLPELPTKADVEGPRAEVAATVDSADDRFQWHQFRGPDGNGAVAAAISRIDWSRNPPREIWRTAIGPGWGSFAFDRGRLFTQEQRGDNEYITCYSADDGSILWSHGDATRFTEVVSGAGPRSTPTFHHGHVYAIGANGLLTCVTADSGAVVWQRDLVQDMQAVIPMWGFSGSPLIVGDLLILHTGAAGDFGLSAFDVRTGRTVWGFPSAGMNYTTARLMTFADEQCIVFGDKAGLHGLVPESGKLLWTFRPDDWKGPAMVDPQQISPTDVIVALGDGVGMARLHVTRVSDEWSVKQQWSGNRLRPSFNDSVVADGRIYGFNQAIFSCIDAKTGDRLWQGGRYGFGQAVLLSDAETIIIAAENGDAVQLRASSDRLEEVSRIPVLNGKTWNHPIVVGDRLFMRNGREAVCLKLSPG